MRLADEPMLDARYLAFVTLSALLVISPGATLAVVVETALAEGRKAALLTGIGVRIANATLALTAAFGLSAVFGRWPGGLELVRLAGAAYLGYLGLRGLWSAARATGSPPRIRADGASAPREVPAGPRSLVVRGVLTNLLNPPVVIFYLTIVPQFIGPADPYLARALLLGATHVTMSILWQGSCGLAVGVAADYLARPAARRILQGVTGLVLVALAGRLLLR